MLIRKASDIRFSEVTPKSLYMRRREFIQAASVAAAGAAAALVSPLVGPASGQTAGPGKLPKLLNIKKSPFSIADKPTAYEQFTTYNNFYEFGTDKDEPSVNAKNFKTRPWTISVEGLVAKPGQFAFEDFIKPHPLEERIYRHRCVETWSAIVPWVGIPLADVVKRFQPTPQAKFIEFITLYDPNQMPGQRSPVLQWPYIEGLRLDEAMNPLAILAVGMYGEVMPNQDGAPIRLVVPWKYGFKGGKSLVKIRFVDQQPKTTWMISGPREYGFYANVNPQVDHPRWSQANDRPLGAFRGQKTLMFNGYADQVASLYTGMDLRKNF